MLTPKLLAAELIDKYVIFVSFADGVSAEINLYNELSGGIFEELKNPEIFSSFKIKKQLGTIEWPNGADFSPEFLYQTAKNKMTAKK